MARWTIYLDANAFIRFLESDETQIANLFEMVAPGMARLYTSELTLAEVLVAPLREGDRKLIDAYEDFISTDETLTVVPVDRAILRWSAEIRATLGGKTPDAIHTATALANGCNIMVSSDQRLRLPASLRRVAVEDVDKVEAWQ